MNTKEINTKIESTQKAINYLEKKIKDPDVYLIWKRKATQQVKELKLELKDLQEKLKTKENEQIAWKKYKVTVQLSGEKEQEVLILANKGKEAIQDIAEHIVKTFLEDYNIKINDLKSTKIKEID